MSWVEDTLDGFLAFLGVLPGDPDVARKTAAATAALELSQSLAESYLDRRLDYMVDAVETWGPPVPGAVLLRRWPVETLKSVTLSGIEADLSTLKADLPRGVIYLPMCQTDPVVVTFDGGLSPFPVDLSYTLQLIAAGLYPGLLGGAAVALGGAPVKRITIPDVGTIELAAAASGQGQAGGLLAPIAGPLEAILKRYRAESAVGAG